MEQRCRECIYKKNINRYPKEARTKDFLDKVL